MGFLAAGVSLERLKIECIVFQRLDDRFVAGGVHEDADRDVVLDNDLLTLLIDFIENLICLTAIETGDRTRDFNALLVCNAQQRAIYCTAYPL